MPTDTSSEPLVPAQQDVESQSPFSQVTYWDIVTNFVLMGWTAFGGPQAHIGMFETTFIQKHGWMSATVFTELFALCSCLPGPTSTQVSFALGAVKKGISGGLLGGVLFQYPGLMMMSAVGVGAATFLEADRLWTSGLIDGLAAVGVALVAVAAKGLVSKACRDPLTSIICLASAVISTTATASWLFPVLIVGGGCVTLAVNSARGTDMAMQAVSGADGVQSFGLGRVAGAMLLVVWFAMLASVTALRAVTDYGNHWVQPLHWFESFYRIGSLVYGGGQVVLPMLIQETVQYDCYTDMHGKRHCEERPDSWITADQFKTGLAIIQAMPGPMFNLSAYLGAVIAIRAGWNWAVGVAACWLGLFGPGLMLMYGLLPFWGQFRASNIYRRSLPGFNAAAVGLVVMAVFDMYNKFTETSHFPKTTVAIGMIGFALVDAIKFPAPATVLVGGLLGIAAALLHFP